jgi:DNA oxidative demethylase
MYLADGAGPGRYRGSVTELIPRPRTEIAPGAVHLSGWLSPDQQRRLVAACREWARPPAGMRATRLPTGGVMSVQTVCLGWHWIPYRYSRTADDVDGAPVKPLPGWLADLGHSAVAAAYGNPAAAWDRDFTACGPHPTTCGPHPASACGPHPAAPSALHPVGADLPKPAADEPERVYRPDVALINYYNGEARMGMHVDKDERSLAPVVSLSLGDSCVFRFGNIKTRNRPWTDIELESGDLFVFGGPSRLAFHGVPKTLPGTGPPDIGLSAGRLNITLRESGLG